MKIIIIIAVLSALFAVAGSVIVGVRTFDGPVTEHPYEEGLAWDEMLRKKKALGWNVEVENRRFRTGDNDMIISIRNSSGEPLFGSTVSVTISRPASSGYDKYRDAVKLKEGLFKIPVCIPLYGHWNIKVNVTQKENTLHYEKRVYVQSHEERSVATTGKVSCLSDKITAR